MLSHSFIVAAWVPVCLCACDLLVPGVSIFPELRAIAGIALLTVSSHSVVHHNGLQQKIRRSSRPGELYLTMLMQLLLTASQDPAPDIYETPDLTDEASTVPVSPPMPANTTINCTNSQFQSRPLQSAPNPSTTMQAPAQTLTAKASTRTRRVCTSWVPRWTPAT
jgi:hypothetical protein